MNYTEKRKIVKKAVYTAKGKTAFFLDPDTVNKFLWKVIDRKLGDEILANPNFLDIEYLIQKGKVTMSWIVSHPLLMEALMAANERASKGTDKWYIILITFLLNSDSLFN